MPLLLYRSDAKGDRLKIGQTAAPPPAGALLKVELVPQDPRTCMTGTLMLCRGIEARWKTVLGALFAETFVFFDGTGSAEIAQLPLGQIKSIRQTTCVWKRDAGFTGRGNAEDLEIEICTNDDIWQLKVSKRSTKQARWCEKLCAACQKKREVGLGL